MVGSFLQARAAKKAGSVQANAATKAGAAQMAMFKITRADLAPYREYGYEAIEQLSNLFLPGEDGEYGEARPDYSEFFKSPGYQFRFDEGARALDRSAAARGRLQSGGYGRELVRYGQGFASNEFNQYANRLEGIAQQGQQAATATGQLGQQAAGIAGQHIANAGTARASGYVGQANAITAGQRNFEQNALTAFGIVAGAYGGAGAGGGGLGGGG